MTAKEFFIVCNENIKCCRCNNRARLKARVGPGEWCFNCAKRAINAHRYHKKPKAG